MRGDGISSNSHRSDLANEWWERAKTKYGLAREVEGCAEGQEEEFSENIDRGIDDTVERIAERHLDYPIDRVDSYSLDISGTRTTDEQCDLTADAYPYENAVGSNLVVATIPFKEKDISSGYYGGMKRVMVGKELPEEINDNEFDIVSAKALAGCNMGSLRKLPNDDAIVVARKVVDLAKRAGVSAANIESMKERFFAAVDIDPKSWATAGVKVVTVRRPIVGMSPMEKPTYGKKLPSVRLPKNRPASEGREKKEGVINNILGLLGVRNNPTPELHMVARVMPATKLVVTSVPPAIPVYYGARPNPVDKKLALDLQRLQELRGSLGWAVFAADPKAP